MTPRYKVLLCTTKYYSSTIPYYSVLQITAKYFSVLQSTTPVLQSTTQYNKELHSTAKCYPILARLIVATHETSSTLRRATSGMQNTMELRHSYLTAPTHETSCTLRGATGVTLQHHQILHQPRKITLMIDLCHIYETSFTTRGATGVTLHHHPILRLSRKKRLSWLILVTYETSCTVRRATGVSLHLHQILRMPRKITLMIDPRHIWNIIYNARSNRCHPEWHWSSSHMKRHLHCAAQQVPSSNVTTYCPCHEKWPSK